MKKTLIAIAAMTLATAAGAQENQQQDAPRNTAHYIALDFGGGFHNLNYSLEDKGKRTPGAGMMARLGYRYFFTPHFGAGIGVNYTSYKTTAKINCTDTYAGLKDTDGDIYNYNVVYSSIKDQQTQTTIGIPVGIYFQCNMTEKWRLGAGLGVMMQFANSNEMDVTSGNLKTTMYIPADKVTFENMENHGLHNYNSDNYNFGYDYDVKTTFGTFAEINFMYALAPWVDIDLGIYGNYGLSKATDNANAPLYNYETNKYNGALNSNITNGSHQLAIGAMVGFRFKIGRNKTESKPKEDDVKPVVVVDNKPEDNKKDEIKQPEVKPEEQQPDNQNIADNSDNKPADNQPENNQVVTINDIIGINTGDKPADNKDAKPEPKKDENKVYTEKGKQVVINGKTYTVVDTVRMIINFDFNSSGNPDITVVDQTLDDVAKYLKDHPDYKLSIVGHTCDLGPDATNKRIGLARANTVKQEFIKRGVAASRLLTSTKASSQPLVPNTSDQNRSRNRRVELEYVK